MKLPIAITGVWLRTSGVEGGRGKNRRRLELLVEVDGVFRLIQEHDVHHDGEISHITEPLGIARAKPDWLTRC